MIYKTSFDKKFDELLIKVQKILQMLSFELSRYSDYELQSAQENVDSLTSKNNPSQPRDNWGRWTTTGNETESGGGNESDVYSRFGGNSKMKIDVAVNYLNKKALPESKGRCAIHVREAIEKCGVKLEDHPIPARLYDPYLKDYDFEILTPTPPDNYSPKKGDIAVFQPPNDKHPDGHIQMYNGTQWVSDFKQPGGFWPGKDFRKHKPHYAIYRP